MTGYGDTIYDDDRLNGISRQDQRELLAGILLEAFSDKVDECTRLSDGEVCDALFLAIDLLIVTDEQKAIAQKVIAEFSGDGDDD